MPVRFRCVYCNQLLGIARRKAGSVVRCTNCDGKIIVPQPEENIATNTADLSTTQREGPDFASHLFERHDFDDLLRPIQESHTKQFQFAEATVNTHAAPTRTDSDTARFRALVQSSAKDSVFASRSWLVITSAIVLALFFLALGFYLARWTA